MPTTPKCVDYIKITYDDYVLKGARSSPIVTFPVPGVAEANAEVPTRGKDIVPRGMYLRPADFDKH